MKKRYRNGKYANVKKYTDEKYTNEERYECTKSMRIKIIRTKKIKQMKSIRIKVSELIIAQNEKQHSNVFLAKPNRKCTKPKKQDTLR